MRRTGILLVIAGVVLFAAAAAIGRMIDVRGTVDRLTGLGNGEPSDSLPDQRQDSAQIVRIRSLRLQREGSATVVTAALAPLGSGGDGGADSARMRWVVQGPDERVLDADLRGYLDGSVRYELNQGTSYHMRVGRRWESPENGRYELKRSLVRFPLPDLPEVARVEATRVVLWVEAFYFGAPLAGPMASSLPLHLYAYPVDAVWEAGAGGVGRDDFSEPAPGEVSWLEARADELSWRTPGALEMRPDDRSGYARPPVATAPIEGGDRRLILRGPGLTSLVEERRSVGSVDLLLKLEDVEEDRPGTELAFLSSDFGDARDLAPKRPRLEIDVRVPCPCRDVTHPFILEAGGAVDLPRQALPPGGSVIAVELSGEAGSIPPDIWIRGGEAGPVDDAAPWAAYDDPVRRSWDWVQVRLDAAVNRRAWGDTLELGLKETWVRPGPRAEQVPEVVLISPSGRTLRVVGEPGDSLRYRMRYVLDEVGLWRYGWSFRPTTERRPGSHHGQGAVWVDIPSDSVGMDGYLDRLRVLVDSLGTGDPLVQSNLNALSRWVGRAAPAERDERRARLKGVLPGR